MPRLESRVSPVLQPRVPSPNSPSNRNSNRSNNNDDADADDDEDDAAAAAAADNTPESGVDFTPKQNRKEPKKGTERNGT